MIDLPVARPSSQFSGLVLLIKHHLTQLITSFSLKDLTSLDFWDACYFFLSNIYHHLIYLFVYCLFWPPKI